MSAVTERPMGAAYLTTMARDAHTLLQQADLAAKGHAAARNAAIVRLVDVYGLSLQDVADGTGIAASIVRNAYYRTRGRL